MDISAFIAAMGIPATIMGLIVWWFKRSIEKKEKKREEAAEKKEKEREEREKNTERLLTMMLLQSRATNVLAKATAKAVQRIPDAHCNGDMTAALKEAEEIQAKENDFLVDQGIKHIFED